MSSTSAVDVSIHAISPDCKRGYQSRCFHHAHCRRTYLVMDIEVFHQRITASRSRAIVSDRDECGVIEHTGVTSRASCCRHGEGNPTSLLTEAARNFEDDAVWVKLVVVGWCKECG